MKKLMNGALLGLVIAVFILMASTYTNGAPILTYVYSNSMEPLIKVNDGFIVWPISKPKIGDIIMYRPVVLKASYVTHRIIQIGENGYITQGDNSPYPDQMIGEPEVRIHHIVGKVVTYQGQPILFPGLGNIPSRIKEGVGSNAKYLSLLFLALSIISLFFVKNSKRRRKPRHRLRLKQVYQSIIWFGMISIIITIFIGSRVSQVKYLVSEYPGTLGNQVEVNHPGELIMNIQNNGLVPIWPIITGIAPLSIKSSPTYLPPKSKGSVIIAVPPVQKTGIYQGYIQIYNYPAFLPRTLVIYLHRLWPTLAMLITGIIGGLLLKLILKLLNRIPGFEEWIPLKAIKDKITTRRIRRVRGKIIGKERRRL